MRRRILNIAKLAAEGMSCRWQNPTQLADTIASLGPEWMPTVLLSDGGLSPDRVAVRKDWNAQLGSLEKQWPLVPEARILRYLALGPTAFSAAMSMLLCRAALLSVVPSFANFCA